MSKAKLWNYATQYTKSKYLFFLDDDNYFISNNSIDNIIKLFSNYDIIFGQIKDSNNKLRYYNSSRVQGTTIGLKKSIIEKIGGFGEWTEKVSCGIDSDLWWKLYHYFQKYHHLQACYTSDIQTLDSCSKRWKTHIKTFFRNYALKKLFEERNGCSNYRSINTNPSRRKFNWIIDLT